MKNQVKPAKKVNLRPHGTGERETRLRFWMTLNQFTLFRAQLCSLCTVDVGHREILGLFDLSYNNK